MPPDLSCLSGTMCFRSNLVTHRGMGSKCSYSRNTLSDYVSPFQYIYHMMLSTSVKSQNILISMIHLAFSIFHVSKIMLSSVSGLEHT